MHDTILTTEGRDRAIRRAFTADHEWRMAQARLARAQGDPGRAAALLARAAEIRRAAGRFLREVRTWPR